MKVFKMKSGRSFFVLHIIFLRNDRCSMPIYPIRRLLWRRKKCLTERNVAFSQDLIHPPAPPPARTINHQRHSHVHNTSTQPSSQMIERKSSIRISVVSHQFNRSNRAAKVCKHSNSLFGDGSE